MARWTSGQVTALSRRKSPVRIWCGLPIIRDCAGPLSQTAPGIELRRTQMADSESRSYRLMQSVERLAFQARPSGSKSRKRYQSFNTVPTTDEDRFLLVDGTIRANQTEQWVARPKQCLLGPMDKARGFEPRDRSPILLGGARRLSYNGSTSAFQALSPSPILGSRSNQQKGGDAQCRGRIILPPLLPTL